MNLPRKATIVNLDLASAVHDSVLKLMLVAPLFEVLFQTHSQHVSKNHSRKYLLDFLQVNTQTTFSKSFKNFNEMHQMKFSISKMN